MTLQNGRLFGMISGKTGELLFSTINNHTEVKELRKKYGGMVSEAWLIERARLKLLVEFLIMFKYFVRIGFLRKPKQHMSVLKVSFSENYPRFIGEAYPNLGIDYSKMILSKGDLKGLSGLKIDRIDQQSFDVKWDFKEKWSHDLDPDGCDRIYCILFDAQDNLAIEVSAGAMRNDNHLLVFLPNEMIGKKIHMYVFLRSSVKKEVSRTQYQCLDLREPKPNEKARNLITSRNTITDKGIKAKKEALRNVAKRLVIPKNVFSKKKPGKIELSVRGYAGKVSGQGSGSMRKSIRQKRP